MYKDSYNSYHETTGIIPKKKGSTSYFTWLMFLWFVLETIRKREYYVKDYILIIYIKTMQLYKVELIINTIDYYNTWLAYLKRTSVTYEIKFNYYLSFLDDRTEIEKEIKIGRTRRN